MKDRNLTRSYRPIVAVVLSLFLCGLGQIYLHRISRGLILILSLSCAIIIVWIALSDIEFNITKWGENQLMFSPSRRSISFREHTYQVTDIMKVTGTIQLAFTWVFSIVDAWREGKKQMKKRAI